MASIKHGQETMDTSTSTPTEATAVESQADKNESLVDKKDVGLEKKVAVTDAHPEDDIEYPHGLKLAVILAALCLAVFLVALDQTIISTAIPKM